MMSSRSSPLPGSHEARAQACTCPAPRVPAGPGEAPPIDAECPVHGRSAIAGDRAAEQGPVDTDGDIVDAANEPELRRQD